MSLSVTQLVPINIFDNAFIYRCSRLKLCFQRCHLQLYCYKFVNECYWKDLEINVIWIELNWIELNRCLSEDTCRWLADNTPVDLIHCPFCTHSVLSLQSPFTGMQNRTVCSNSNVGFHTYYMYVHVHQTTWYSMDELITVYMCILHTHGIYTVMQKNACLQFRAL